MSPADRITIAVASAREADVQALVEAHLRFAHDSSPACHVHALAVDGLAAPGLTVYAARRDAELLGVVALREIDARHGEVKSMHTQAAARRLGVGRLLLDHLLAVARARGYERVSLETGTEDAFVPARSLYERAGFVRCPPFGEYTENPHSVCMTLTL